MKILVTNTDFRLFLTPTREWTSNEADAITFGSLDEAICHCQIMGVAHSRVITKERGPGLPDMVTDVETARSHPVSGDTTEATNLRSAATQTAQGLTHLWTKAHGAAAKLLSR
jgi:hypothetical protein